MSRTTNEACDHQEAMLRFEAEQDDSWIAECMERAEFETRTLPAVRAVRPELTKAEEDMLWFMLSQRVH